MKKHLLKVLVPLICIAVVGIGVNTYMKRAAERKRQVALEEQRRQEEAERERARRLLEEKREAFAALVAEMRRLFEKGEFAAVREISKDAFALAERHGFPTEEVEGILRSVDVAIYIVRLNELHKLTDDMYRYFYVRSETLKIPAWKELQRKRANVLRWTYNAEYRAMLALARKNSLLIEKGELPHHHYSISRKYLEQAIRLRERQAIECAEEEERLIRELKRENFFASRRLVQETIPPSLY